MLITESLLNQIYEILSQIGFLPMLLIIYMVVMYVFWYNSYKANKDSGSVFDQWFFTTIIMIIWGRVAYIIEFWGYYMKWPWFWLPYEKYGDTVYWFRTLPWRFFAIWDGGFLFIPMFFAFLLLSYFYVVRVKRWR